MSIDAPLSGILRLLLPAAVLAAVALAVFAVLDRLALDQRAAERRALIERSAQLNLSALAPGSALACLDGSAGEAAETACEAAVFVSPQSTAAAAAYVGARLTLLADAHVFSQAHGATKIDAIAATRRAIELDRYGVAAHVLSVRDGCTPERCAAFALFDDTSALKANLKAQVFDQYVSRHTATWNTPAVAPAPEVPRPSVSEAPAVLAPQAKADANEPPGRPVSSKYSFPSAASIPPVSIMNSEPALPKESSTSAPAANGAATDDKTPVPPKRPQAQREQAATPPAR